MQCDTEQIKWIGFKKDVQPKGTLYWEWKTWVLCTCGKPLPNQVKRETQTGEAQ